MVRTLESFILEGEEARNRSSTFKLRCGSSDDPSSHVVDIFPTHRKSLISFINSFYLHKLQYEYIILRTFVRCLATL